MISNSTHKTLITLLFRDPEYIINKLDFNKINYDDLVKLASGYLMLPALYVRIKQNKLLKFIDHDFKQYIKNIYELNKSRNSNLLKELRELSSLFQKNKIDHVFLKGSAYIAYGKFVDLGERMIGDIDVLVSKSDYEKSINLSKHFGYKNESVFFVENRHYPRMVHSKKIFALEIHNRLLMKKNELLEPNFVLQNKIKTDYGIYTPNKTQYILHTIYSHQINDFWKFLCKNKL